MHTRATLTVLLSVMQFVSTFGSSALATAGTPTTPSTAIGEQMPAGNVSSTMRSNDQVRTFALQSDGKLIVAGLSDGSATKSFALARYQPNGGLDSRFGTHGLVTTRVGSDDAEITALALQPDGKIIAAGRTYSTLDPTKPIAFALTRYQPDGSVDLHFGTDGIVTTAVSLGPLGTVSAVAVQPDGKLVVLVRPFETGGDFFLFRYLANGSMDPSFGSTGRVTGVVGFRAETLALALQADGTIVVAGTEMRMIGALGIVVPPEVTDFCPGPSGRKVFLARYHADGSLETSFGSGGIHLVDLHTFRAVRALAFQPDGKVLVVGDADCHFALTRYQADGSLDTSFGTDGVASSHKGAAVLFTVTPQPDGKIVALGTFYDDLLLVRYAADGQLDTNFGTSGTVTLSLNEAHALTVQPDGQLAVAGSVYDADYDFAVLRYNHDGSPDVRFGTGGTVTTNFATLMQVDDCQTMIPPFPQLPRGYRGKGPPVLQDAAATVVLQPDGKIVVAGTADYALTLLRYQPDGALDPSFGTHGAVTTRISTHEKYADLASALALQTDGKIVVAGAAWILSGYGFFLARYNSDGSLDTSFGTAGTVTSSIGTGASAVTVQPDGNIVVLVGSSGFGTTASLVRFRPDGSVDPSFGSGGTITTVLHDVRASLLQADGKIVVPGFKTLAVTKKAVQLALVLVRYRPDGSVDPSFAASGTVTIDTQNGTVYPFSFALQADGKIVGGGLIPYAADLTELFVLTRYNPDGSLDASFGPGGKITIPTKSLISARGTPLITLIPRSFCTGFCRVAVQDDGKIVALGSPDSSAVVLLRYNSDGNLDPTFGDGGKVTTAVGSRWDIAGTLAFQTDGKIVVAGTCANARHTNISLLRYNPDGSLDPTFDRGGKVTTRVGAGIVSW